jgi:hypothetical protein
MKLKSSDTQRRGDTTAVAALFHDRFRKPLDIKIVTAKSEDPGLKALWMGDPHDVLGLFGGLAEIAWDMGWRPRGFEGKLVQTVRSFQIPPEEK